MTMKDLSKYSEEQLERLSFELTARGNLSGACRVDEVRKYYHKRVRVVKGRKVPHGTEGECFWMGCYDNSKYGDPWGIYTSVRVGIKDENGNVYWTSVDNIDLV